MEVKISDTLSLITNSIEIVTSKVDKKYADEQGGTGEGNYPCNLCTSKRSDMRDLQCIENGFEINRTCAQGHEVAEGRRVNVDKLTQDTLKEKAKGWKSVPMLSSEYVRRGFDDLHGCTSWGRWAIRIMIRLRAGIFSETITGDVKPLFETAKKILRDVIKRSRLGIDIHMDLKGREAQALFALKNKDIVEKLVPEEYEEEWSHFLSEARYALAIVCSPDPAKHFDLPHAEPRLKRFQIWLVNTWPSFNQPDYVHPTLMHTIQLLTRPGALKSISQYGTQNKEAKNQKNNQYLATMARMNDFIAALEDVYTRDSQASSVEIRKLGESQPVQHCSKCKKLGHRAPNCGKNNSNQKFVDLDSLDPIYRGRRNHGDSESEDDTVDQEDINSNLRLVGSSASTPRGRGLRLDENLNESPADNTRSKKKAQPSTVSVTSDNTKDTGAKRKLLM